jgi:hypothetical protein
MLGRRGFSAGLLLAAGGCGGKDDRASEELNLPTRTRDGRIIVRGQGLAYAISAPPGWNLRSVRAADRSNKSTVTVADIGPTDGTPVSISGQMRSRTREFDSINAWVEQVTRTRRVNDSEFSIWRAGPAPVPGGRRSELVILEAGKPANDGPSSVDHEAVVLIEEPGAIVEIFLTTRTKELRDQHLPTLRAVAATYGPAT